jgi:hypothetical protein
VVVRASRRDTMGGLLRRRHSGDASAWAAIVVPLGPRRNDGGRPARRRKEATAKVTRRRPSSEGAHRIGDAAGCVPGRHTRGWSGRRESNPRHSAWEAQWSPSESKGYLQNWAFRALMRSMGCGPRAKPDAQCNCAHHPIARRWQGPRLPTTHLCYHAPDKAASDRALVQDC